MKRWRQQELNFRTRGGRRRGAWRKRRHFRPQVPHRARPAHAKAHPVHVTLRARDRLPSLRRQVLFGEIRQAIGQTTRSWFRIIHFSVQADHIHLLVEASDKGSLSRGLIGITIRVALAVNRVLRRKGKVWDDRYHSRPLRTPREVRNGLVYVLMNWKKHARHATDVDPCSSAGSFTGWKVPPSTGPPGDRLVAAPMTWLLQVGWRRHGLIELEERPKTS
jgi:REP element-mobilizing transposase RayT